ncbi:MAG: thiazole synthase [Deltaproteobacteria bacterium]|nr:thiazole synthase [Deltaproteobacteria bacterium]
MVNQVFDDKLIIAGRAFASRLLTGTGKFGQPEQLRAALAASGTEIVTVAVRRVDFENPEDRTLAAVDRDRYLLLPNTSGARDAIEAVRIAKIASAIVGHRWVKLEVTPEPDFLLPDGVETLQAARELVAQGFTVLPYMNADPILARHLEEAGCATLMPLAAPIGSNRGLRTADQIRIIVEQARVPVVVDAGLGAPSHAAAALELGADAVLVNTAIATAADPVAMARAFALAVDAGRRAYLAGLSARGDRASASSPLVGQLGKVAP